MKINRFEDLECWQEARVLTRSIYGYAKRPDFSKDFRLSGQITGASISIMNNILTYSRRSCSEVQNCLYIALDQSYITDDEFQNTYRHCEKIRKMIDGLIRYLRKN